MTPHAAWVHNSNHVINVDGSLDAIVAGNTLPDDLSGVLDQRAPSEDAEESENAGGDVDDEDAGDEPGQDEAPPVQRAEVGADAPVQRAEVGAADAPAQRADVGADAPVQRADVGAAAQVENTDGAVDAAADSAACAIRILCIHHQMICCV